MFTETELVDAMRHSAHRADDLPDNHVELGPALPRASRHGRRLLLPAAAAATVLALATGAVLLTGNEVTPQPSSNRSTTPPAPTSVATRPAAESPNRVPHHHVAADISGVLDPVQIDASVFANWFLGGNGDAAAGSSNVEHPIPDTEKLVDLDVVGSRADFDPNRIPRDHPVPIAGTTGYYANFKLFPLDANQGPSSKKYPGFWTIAFRTPAGDWAFVHIEKPSSNAGFDDLSVADPTAIVAAYDSLGVTFTAARSRVPLRTGYLPSGMRLVGTSFSTGSADSGLVDASFAAGAKRIDIQLAPLDGDADPSGAGCGTLTDTCHDATAVIGGYRVEVGSSDYDATTVRNIIRTLRVVPDAKDRSIYWTLADAFG